jgi:hypothetical protein
LLGPKGKYNVNIAARITGFKGIYLAAISLRKPLQKFANYRKHPQTQKRPKRRVKGGWIRRLFQNGLKKWCHLAELNCGHEDFQAPGEYRLSVRALGK